MDQIARLVAMIGGLEDPEEKNIPIENSPDFKRPSPRLDEANSGYVSETVPYECVMDEGTLSFNIEENQAFTPISKQNGHVEKSKEQQAWSRLSLVENFKNNIGSREIVKNNSAMDNLKNSNNNSENQKNRNIDLRNNVEAEENSMILKKVGNDKLRSETEPQTEQKIGLPRNNVDTIPKFDRISYYICCKFHLLGICCIRCS